jgi:hypothetical protein
MQGLVRIARLSSLLLVIAPRHDARQRRGDHSFDAARVARTASHRHRADTRAGGGEIKRGIYRDFPLTFTDAGGKLHK